MSDTPPRAITEQKDRITVMKRKGHGGEVSGTFWKGAVAMGFGQGSKMQVDSKKTVNLQCTDGANEYRRVTDSSLSLSWRHVIVDIVESVMSGPGCSTLLSHLPQGSLREFPSLDRQFGCMWARKETCLTSMLMW